jgi:hypothetical protein
MIILPDDELRRLEKQFGPEVWRMGSWNSDGVFGYCAVSTLEIETAAAAAGDPALREVLGRLTSSPDRTRAFLEMLESFGLPLIERIVAIHRACAMSVRPNSETSAATRAA